jgi:ATP-dependent DNA helicase RecG
MINSVDQMKNNESQNREYKENWRDEYLKWICGFANAQGGTLYIGIRDNGYICGINDAKKLMEDIPNKVRDMMGILVDVNLKEEDGKDYLEIITEPYPYPISYKGQYHVRSGSTKQELKGAALDRFLLRKQGKTWDSVPLPYLKAEDLDSTTIDRFRKFAQQSERMEERDLRDNNHDLLEKLRLFEGPYLKRAAALLFYPDPEKYITGAYIKIGYFKTDDDLIYQDEIHGNLFRQVDLLLSLLTTKYLKATIRYEGIHRIEDLSCTARCFARILLECYCS